MRAEPELPSSIDAEDALMDGHVLPTYVGDGLEENGKPGQDLPDEDAEKPIREIGERLEDNGKDAKAQ